VARHGRLVAEYYFGGTDSTLCRCALGDEERRVRLTGIALRDGVLPGTATSVAPYLAAVDTLDSADSAVTLRDLLTMTSGYAWDETNGADYNTWIVADDHVQYLLDRAHAAPPAPRSPTTPRRCTHSAWCSRRRRDSAPSLRHRPSVRSTGRDTVAWEALDRGTVNGGSGIALRARDLLKFGSCSCNAAGRATRAWCPRAGWTRSPDRTSPGAPS